MMRYRVICFFDQAGARPFHPGEFIVERDRPVATDELTPDQVKRAIDAGFIEAEAPPTEAAPKPPIWRSKTAKKGADTTMPKDSE